MPRPMLRVPRPRYHYSPFKTKTKGFNTEFSVEELRCKLRNNKALDLDELVFVDYLKSKELW